MGLLIALLVLLLWGGHLFWMFLFLPVDPSGIWLWIHLVVQAYLFTGLFITAHDAMHGTVSPNRKVNDLMGMVVTFLYAGMWYPKMKDNPYEHHASPRTPWWQLYRMKTSRVLQIGGRHDL